MVNLSEEEPFILSKMIPYERDRQQTIPSSSLKVIGLGGAGANMLDRAALDGMDGAELLALNTDMRTLAQSVAADKLQLGPQLTKGLGAGGDPELGKQAVLEVEQQVRDALKGRKIVFLCVGLGGGTGSGAAPIVTRVAREEGAFVVVFATMPFGFEGQRRRDQAETALNELAVLSNALVTFDNGRMGELVLAKQGIHEAFSAADRMISESIKAVTRLVIKPGLVNVGLDDLVTALKTNRSRCLFGSGIATGKNRAQTALKNALASPLLDRGSLLQDAESVMVHVSGGPDMTLYEVELLMQGLTKHVPKSAHILFGAAIDEGMKDSLSVTVISALPENKLTATLPSSKGAAGSAVGGLSVFQEVDDEDEDDAGAGEEDDFAIEEDTPEPAGSTSPQEEVVDGFEEPAWEDVAGDPGDDEEVEATTGDDDETDGELEEEAKKGAEPFVAKKIIKKEPEKSPEPAAEVEIKDDWDEIEEIVPLQPKLKPKDKSKGKEKEARSKAGADEDDLSSIEDSDWAEVHQPKKSDKASDDSSDVSSKGAMPKSNDGQPELELDGGPKGRFEGESPNLVDGEDLDVPPYLRKRAK